MVYFTAMKIDDPEWQRLNAEYQLLDRPGRIAALVLAKSKYPEGHGQVKAIDRQIERLKAN
jgi:hypothetical protein